ncbi:MAG: glycosyltransferase family 2 protein [Alphaproteobacteria bacterium]|nr:glycosyltransferase family 2 protein [Alphaproteobacteria bacterium]
MKGSEALWFIIPHFRDTEARSGYLAACLRSLQAQTDPDWHAVVVDDGSPGAALQSAEGLEDPRVAYIRLPANCGPGVARNVGVRYAINRGARILSFQDDDDLAHPERVSRTRVALASCTGAEFVYSSFVPIDRQGREIARASVRGDMREILDALDAGPPVGPRAWVDIATRTGFIATTSTVSVRSSVALRCPFPPLRVSEDSHTWLRMSASGATVCFAPAIPTSYRIANAGEECSSQRSNAFLYSKSAGDSLGFAAAVRFALRRGEISRDDAASLTRMFCARLASTIERQGLTDLADQIRSYEFARRVSSIVPIRL